MKLFDKEINEEKYENEIFQPKWLVEILRPQPRVIRPATVREKVN